MTQAKRKKAAADSPPKAAVSGYQEGVKHPRVQVTPQDFANLLDNPEKPAESQSAPSPEQLNPHLFPERL